VSNPAQLRDEIARLSLMIGTARHMVAKGSAVDLSPVGEGISALCGAVSALPDEQGVALREDLLSLSDRLGRLATDIQARLAANDGAPDSAPDAAPGASAE
jgi:hypothetical protein